MIFTSYFNYFDNANRKNNFLKFKRTFNCVTGGIGEDPDINLDSSFTTNQKLFLKENILNLTIKQNIDNADYIFWIDADVSLLNGNWMDDAMQKLNSHDVVQLFSDGHHMDSSGITIERAPGYVYNQQKFNKHGHTGYAWGMTKQAFLHLGGLYEYNVIGSGDAIMARCFLQKPIPSFEESKSMKKLSFYPFSEGHQQTIVDYYNKCKDFKVSYLDNIITHGYHGELERRKYVDRYKILEKHSFDPQEMLIKNTQGILQFKDQFSDIKNDIEEFLRYKDELPRNHS